MNRYTLLLRDIIHKSVNDLKNIDDEEWRFKANPSQWSKLEIIGHLIDSAYHNHRRFTDAALQEHLIFDGYSL